eukprot:scaffold4823_cov98-Isochrysis_galbana.AAC.2
MLRPTGAPYAYTSGRLMSDGAQLRAHRPRKWSPSMWHSRAAGRARRPLRCSASLSSGASAAPVGCSRPYSEERYSHQPGGRAGAGSSGGSGGGKASVGGGGAADMTITSSTKKRTGAAPAKKTISSRPDAGAAP